MRFHKVNSTKKVKLSGLGKLVKKIIVTHMTLCFLRFSNFEDTITDIHKEDCEKQENLLTGYKKLLEEQINVINAN